MGGRYKMRAIKTTFTTAALVMLVPVSLAHRPMFSDRSGLGPDTAVPVSRPEVSQVIYRELSAETRQLWLSLDADAGFGLYVQIGVPVLERLRSFRPAVLVVGPGLGQVLSPVALPEGTGGIDLRTDDVANPRFFHEPFTNTDSWILRSETVTLPAAGRYYVVAYHPSGEGGKFWLAVGQKEDFGVLDFFRMGEWTRKIQAFHEVGRKGPSGSSGQDVIRSRPQTQRASPAYSRPSVLLDDFESGTADDDLWATFGNPWVGHDSVLETAAATPQETTCLLSQDAGFADFTATFDMRIVTAGADRDSRQFCFRMAADKTQGIAGGYGLQFRLYDSAERQLQLHRGVPLGRGFTRIAEVRPYPFEAGTWYTVRVQAVGPRIAARVWPRGLDEPSAWDIDTTDPTYAMGRIGFCNYRHGVAQFDNLAVRAVGRLQPGDAGDGAAELSDLALLGWGWLGAGAQ